MSNSERVKRCRSMAAEVAKLAAEAKPVLREEYLEIAKEWTVLGDEIETMARNMRGDCPDKHA